MMEPFLIEFYRIYIIQFVEYFVNSKELNPSAYIVEVFTNNTKLALQTIFCIKKCDLKQQISNLANFVQLEKTEMGLEIYVTTHRFPPQYRSVLLHVVVVCVRQNNRQEKRLLLPVTTHIVLMHWNNKIKVY